MADANQETAPPAVLRTGLIAPASETARLVEAIAATPGLELVAQSGVPQPDAVAGAEWFDDRRVLLARSGVSVAVFGSSSRIGFELAQTAIAAGIHVWRRPPLGRTFGEAVEAAQHARGALSVYRVASHWEHERAAVRDCLRAAGDARPLISEAFVAAAGPPLASWRSGEAEAGGGVLLQDAYAALEQLVAVRGMPETVWAAVERCRRRANEPPRETEDVALVILRYANGSALLRATWDVHAPGVLIRHHGPTWTTTQSDATLRAETPDGAAPAGLTATSDVLRAELEAFVRLVRGQEPREENLAAIGRHLAVSAVLEAAYLSARTGQPESPRRLYAVHGVSGP